MNENNGHWVEEVSVRILNLWDPLMEFYDAPSEASAARLLGSWTAIKQLIERHVPQTTALPQEMIRSDLDTERLLFARKRAVESDADSLLSVRIPEYQVRYLSRFQSRANGHRSTGRKREITKQEMVAEALCLFYAVHRLPSELEII